MRLTTIGRVLVVASNDARLAGLLEKAEKLALAPAVGPLMTGEIDLGGYLTAAKGWVRKGGGELPPLPPLGRMIFQGDMGRGRASFEMSIRLKDVQSLIAYGAALAPSAEVAEGQQPEDAAETAAARRSDRAGSGKPEAEPEPGTLKVPPRREAVPVEKDAEYWTTRAYLCTTYGNDKAAIRFFKKAIALSPGSSNLYFQMGISYGELGYYQAALGAIDKAISLGGDKGLYYYGRGRVLLQSGKDAEGMADIRKAAEMGDLDAIQYLEGMNPKPAG
jgi:tetratricopeptide (TPR) repeat protein